MNKFLRACILSAAMLTVFGTTAAVAQNDGGRREGMNPEQIVARLMQRDTNGDGKLSRDELPDQLAERLFEVGDANKDGFLDKAEIEKAFANRTANRTPGARSGQQVQPGESSKVRGPVRGTPRAASAKEMDFEDYMKVAGKALHKLRRSPLDVTSQKKDLKAIQAVQFGLINAKARIGTVKMAPQAKEHYASDEKTYLHDFHVGLTRALMESFALEMAILEGDTAKAKESLTYLREAQKKGHDAFQEDEDDDDEAHEHGDDDEDHEHGDDDDDDDDDDD